MDYLFDVLIHDQIFPSYKIRWHHRFECVAFELSDDENHSSEVGYFIICACIMERYRFVTKTRVACCCIQLLVIERTAFILIVCRQLLLSYSLYFISQPIHFATWNIEYIHYICAYNVYVFISPSNSFVCLPLSVSCTVFLYHGNINII